MNSLITQFATWLESQSWSVDLHGSYYVYNWVESTHVVTLMLSLGMLVIVDLRMLGLCFRDVPASTVAARLSKPMLAGFVVMFITGIVLYAAIPVRTSHSVWFRLKLILLVAAAINAWLFHRHMNASKGVWDLAPRPPRRMQVAAALSLMLWAGIVLCGRFIAYDWFDCDQQDNSELVVWLAGCPAT